MWNDNRNKLSYVDRRMESVSFYVWVCERNFHARCRTGEKASLSKPYLIVSIEYVIVGNVIGDFFCLGLFLTVLEHFNNNNVLWPKG